MLEKVCRKLLLFTKQDEARKNRDWRRGATGLPDAVAGGQELASEVRELCVRDPTNPRQVLRKEQCGLQLYRI